MMELVNMVLALNDNDGLTLKNYKPVHYKTGWQVATTNNEYTTAEEAIEAVKSMNGNAGIWYADGIYYVDCSFRVKTKRHAMLIAEAYNQLSVFKWETMTVVYR